MPSQSMKVKGSIQVHPKRAADSLAAVSGPRHVAHEGEGHAQFTSFHHLCRRVKLIGFVCNLAAHTCLAHSEMGAVACLKAGSVPEIRIASAMDLPPQ